MRRILFCNIAYMQHYDCTQIKEAPKYGGRYVAETGDAYEKDNYHICEDNIVRGFVETMYIDGSASAKRPRQIRIENIDPYYKKAAQIDGVLVVFCAHYEVYNKTVIVGWYKDATVYRERPKYNGRQYNIECLETNAFLLPEKARNFSVPRAAKDEFGFGQSNVWYAKEMPAEKFVEDVIKYIDDSDVHSVSNMEIIPQEIADQYIESGIGKKITVNKYERNSMARRKCLEIHGTNCVICGFNAADIYGSEFANKIEVHHIVPINQISKEYKVDPASDLIPVCPNCHMILHTKTKAGKYPTVGMMRDIYLRGQR